MANEFFLAIRGKWKASGQESFIVNVYGPHDDCRNKIIGKQYTRISDDGTKFSKLNRFLVTDKFLNLLDDLSIIALDRKLSEHCLLVLRDKIIDYGPKPFKVFDVWFNNEDVGQVISDAWVLPMSGQRNDCIFRAKLKNVKGALKAWSIKSFGSLDCEINSLKKEARDWEKEVRDWEAKTETNSITENECLVWLEARDRDAVRNCASTKTPGPDGFNLCFYKNFWSTIRSDLTGYFWGKGEISSGFNASFVTFISKKLEPSKFNEYLPISLIGSLYKIVAKLLLNHFKKVIPKLVGFEQSAFIKGRNIMNGKLIANETLEVLKQNNSKSLIFKVYFKKVFDSLSWEFLLDMIMGFGDKWRK
ncbi:uncharacterized protein [Rutidosis leptorrhynchoides]|uniref:uncharacterized protein n=1 Tax=Rutidosis leptorrhynchoides TaxID=125765 RepID=UPI003A9A1D2A